MARGGYLPVCLEAGERGVLGIVVGVAVGIPERPSSLLALGRGQSILAPGNPV